MWRPWHLAAVLMFGCFSFAACDGTRKYIFVSKRSEHGVTWHRFSGHKGAADGYQPITGANLGGGEISFFGGFSQTYDLYAGINDWGRKWYCRFNLGLHIMEATTPGQNNRNRQKLWILKQGGAYTGFRIVDTVYVADSSCWGEVEGLTELYYIACSKRYRGGHETLYSRVSTQPITCGRDYRHHERKVYAFVDNPMCPEIPYPTSGQRQETTDGPRVTEYTYSCDAGYRLQGGSSIRCLSNGRWSGPAPQCQHVTCRALRNPSNGRLSTSDRHFGISVTYNCDRGYQLQPHGATVMCQDNGQWSRNEMQCQLVDCGHPDIPDDGRVQADLRTTFGQMARFSCHRGFRRSGSRSATCGADGRWQYSRTNRPSCRGIRCPELEHPENGRAIGNSRAVDAQWTFRCNDGYALEGAETIKCEQDEGSGRWSGTVPNCKVMFCAAPTAPENGKVEGHQHSYGSVIRYSCNAGFRLQGADRSTCRMAGWDGQVPACLAVTCPDPGVSEHAERVGPSHSAGATVTYTCESGYTLRGAASITCGNDGRWTSRRPQCEPVACERFRPLRYGSRDGDALTFGSTVKFTCHPGYQMQGDAQSTCQAGGTWSNAAPTCTACLKGSYKEKSEDRECSLCPEHSTTVTTASSSRQHCTCADGTIGPLGGPCTVVKCEALSAPENGQLSVDCGTDFNAECGVTCEPGYVLTSGSRRRRCMADGWTGSPPTCTACPANTYKLHPGAVACTPCPQNTVTTPGTPASSIQACKCAPGFTGTPGGTCTDIDECRINNGGCNQTCENTLGSSFCRCHIPGYVLMDNGKTCTKNQSCPALTQQPSHGSLECIYTEGTNGHICFIRCQQGFFFVSGINNYLTCGSPSEFEWSHRVLNKTARIPACTREFFVDIDLPLRLNYKPTGGCSAPRMDQDALVRRLEAAVNTIPVCLDKCRVNDVNITCQEDKDESVVNFDVLLQNPHPHEVPFNCTPVCKRKNMRAMLRDTFQLKQQVQSLVTTQPQSFQLPSQGAPIVDPSSFWFGKPRMLCDPGRVLTKNRLCVPCDRGFYLPERQLETCLPCPKGTYQNEYGQTSCKPCLEGSSTMITGADHPTMCTEKVSIMPVGGDMGGDLQL